MSEAAKDTFRAKRAAAEIIDGRTVDAQIMVTLEHTVATVLIALYRDPRKAAGMLNEGLVQGIEGRLALFASKQSS